MAYSTREQGVGLLAPLTGSPPSAVQLLSRLHDAHAIAGKGIWSDASAWFVALEQSHTAFPALAGFPSQREDRSWVATAGTVLDAASLVLSAADLEDDQPLMPGLVGDERAELGGLVLVLIHGASAMTGIARASAIDVLDPSTLVEMVAGGGEGPDGTSVTRQEYEEAIDELCAAGALGDRGQGARVGSLPAHPVVLRPVDPGPGRPDPRPAGAVDDRPGARGRTAPLLQLPTRRHQRAVGRCPNE